MPITYAGTGLLKKSRGIIDNEQVSLGRHGAGRSATGEAK